MNNHFESSDSYTFILGETGISAGPVFDEIEKQIISFEKLEQGWDFGVGDKIDESIIQEALSIYSKLKYFDSFKFSVYPTSNGGITLSLALDDNFIDILINDDQTLTLREEKGFGSNFEVIGEIEEVSFFDINSRLLKIIEDNTQCKLFEPYTSISTTFIKDDFKLMPSLITMEESLYFP